MRFGLLDVMEDSATVRIRDDATEVGGSIFADTSTENDGLGISFLEKSEHVEQWERAANISVQDEEALWATLEDSITEVVETSSSTKRLVLTQVLDCDLWELGGGILDEIAEDMLFVVSDHADFLNVGDFRNRGETVPDDRMTGDFEKWLFE